MLDCECNGAATGAQIQHWRRIPFKCQIDQQFGLGPRDEDRRIDRQLEAVELLAPQDVGDRNSRFSFFYQIKECVFDFERDFLLGRRGQAGLRKTANLG